MTAEPSRTGDTQLSLDLDACSRHPDECCNCQPEYDAVHVNRHVIIEGTACVDCGTPMIGGKRRPPAGWRCHGGRGYCKVCYDRTFRRSRGGARYRVTFEWYRVELALTNGGPLTIAERAVAVEILSRRGWPARQIAGHLDITARTVHRIRARARDAGRIIERPVTRLASRHAA